MEQNKNGLLFEQINKISKVISTLSENVSQADVVDKISLSVARDNVKNGVRNNMAKTTYTVIDLFAGIGAFHPAMHSVGMKCVLAREWD